MLFWLDCIIFYLEVILISHLRNKTLYIWMNCKLWGVKMNDYALKPLCRGSRDCHEFAWFESMPAYFGKAALPFHLSATQFLPALWLTSCSMQFSSFAITSLQCNCFSYCFYFLLDLLDYTTSGKVCGYCGRFIKAICQYTHRHTIDRLSLKLLLIWQFLKGSFCV